MKVDLAFFKWRSIVVGAVRLASSAERDEFQSTPSQCFVAVLEMCEVDGRILLE
jgi:hypothetical protein